MKDEFLAQTVAIVVIVSGIAGVAIVNSGNSGPYTPGDYPCYLSVLGNADLDLDFDSDDIVQIQKAIDDPEGHPYDGSYMCDADRNGVIDDGDISKVRAIIHALQSGDWSLVGTVHYINVDQEIVPYDMTLSNKVITLIAPPLDSVLAMGGRDLVVGFDDRITVGKYYSEYAKTFDFSKMMDVGSCSEPSTERIIMAAKEHGGVNVVCGTKMSYGPSLEYTFKDSPVQIIRVASWEYGETVYGFLTLAFLLKMTEGAMEYYNWYKGLEDTVAKLVETVPEEKRSAGHVGAACCYGYMDELSLLGDYSGEYANLMSLDPYDSAEAYLDGQHTGGHGVTITTEGISAMYQQYHLRNLLLLIGTPFQVKTASGDAQSTLAYMASIYGAWEARIGAYVMPDLRMCIQGYSFSSGVSNVLNELIFAYWMYNEEFLGFFGCDDQREAQGIIAGYVDGYCRFIGIDALWSFYGEDHGGPEGTIGMNLLYFGKDSELNIMYGPVKGSTDVDG